MTRVVVPLLDAQMYDPNSLIVWTHSAANVSDGPAACCASLPCTYLIPVPRSLSAAKALNPALTSVAIASGSEPSQETRRRDRGILASLHHWASLPIISPSSALVR